MTYSFDFPNGNYHYLKAEIEGLKRFDVSQETFLVGRFHIGTFPYKQTLRAAPEVDPVDRYSIPRGELFSLDGRDNLRGLKDKRPGTEEAHVTWEYFFPWFLDAQRNFLHVDWQNWYWVLYAGYGTAGFDRRVFTDGRSYVPDAGVGFESTIQLRKKFRFFLSGVLARALKGSGGVEARLSIKAYR